MDNSIKVKLLGMGHLPRQLEAIREGLDVAIKKLDAVTTTYCRYCGTELLHNKEWESGGQTYVIKNCPLCGEEFVFNKLLIKSD